MITQGKYSVWFKTPVGEGAGVVEFGPNGKLSGGDTTFAYVENWEQVGERFKSTLSAKRIAPGPPGVFGMDEIDIIVAGHSDGDASTSHERRLGRDVRRFGERRAGRALEP